MSRDINKRIDDLEGTLNGKISEIKKEVQADISNVQRDVQNVKSKIEQIEKFNPERTVIISGLPMLQGENIGILQRTVENMLAKLGPNVACQVKSVMRIPSRVQGKHGLVKAEFHFSRA